MKKIILITLILVSSLSGYSQDFQSILNAGAAAKAQMVLQEIGGDTICNVDTGNHVVNIYNNFSCSKSYIQWYRDYQNSGSEFICDSNIFGLNIKGCVIAFLSSHYLHFTGSGDLRGIGFDSAHSFFAMLDTLNGQVSSILTGSSPTANGMFITTQVNNGAHRSTCTLDGNVAFISNSYDTGHHQVAIMIDSTIKLRNMNNDDSTSQDIVITNDSHGPFINAYSNINGGGIGTGGIILHNFRTGFGTTTIAADDTCTQDVQFHTPPTNGNAGEVLMARGVGGVTNWGIPHIPVDTTDPNFIIYTQNMIANSYANTNTQDYYIGIFDAPTLSLDYYVYPTVGRNFSKIDIDSVNTNLTITSTPIPSYLANVYNYVTIIMPFYDSVTVSPSSSVHFDPITGIPGKTGVLHLIYSARKQAYIEDTPFKVTY